MDRRPNEHKPQRHSAPPQKRKESAFSELRDELRQLFSPGNFRAGITAVGIRLKAAVYGFAMHVFYSRERILCGAVCAAIMGFLALLQTTLFSSIRPFGGVPDLMISFTLALSVTEGRRWGAIWGIVAAVIIEALGVPDIMLLPLLYMPIGYFGGVLCRHYFTGSAVVRTLMTLALLPLRGLFTWISMAVSPLYAAGDEIFFGVILPEAAATLLWAAPVHLLLYVCLRPFHRTRAEMVSEK